MSIVLGLLAGLKPLLYFPLMTRFHTSPRTAVLASGVLANHSEFGLIVVSVAAAVNWLDPEWSAALSIAVAVSFVVAAPISSATHEFYRKYRDRLLSFQSPELVSSFEPTDGARIVILGMGRVGTGAYDALAPSGTVRCSVLKKWNLGSRIIFPRSVELSSPMLPTRISGSD